MYSSHVLSMHALSQFYSYLEAIIEEYEVRNWGQFHRGAEQSKLLVRNICLANFFGYQPNSYKNVYILAGSLFYIA